MRRNRKGFGEKKPSRDSRDKGCENCADCSYIGEGDFVCINDESKVVLVISSFVPTGDYMKCGGKGWSEA
jgi:hypothetical protein